MKLGIIISTNELEIVWNVYRLANFALNGGNKVKIFLLARGVESEIRNEKYNVKKQITQFVSNGGKIYACGTCMKSRNIDTKNICSLSSMKDLYQIVKESDKVLTF